MQSEQIKLAVHKNLFSLRKMLTEYIEAATTGKFYIEFAEITLSRNDTQSNQIPLRGKGYLIQDGEQFRFTLFPDDQRPLPLDYFLRHLASANNLIPRDTFFTAHCTALDGTQWAIEDILPSHSSGQSGCVVYAGVREVSWHETAPAQLSGSHYSATLFFLGKHDFYTNEIIKTERSVGDNMKRP